jgi:hypothetical protein
MTAKQTPTGVETDTSIPAPFGATRATRTLALPQHTRLTAVELVDRTDRHNELVHERQYLLHPARKLALPLRGNLFAA